MNLSDLTESLRRRLDDKTSARERGLSASRSAIRACGNSIRAMHRYEMDAARKLLAEAQEQLDGARSALAEHDDMLHAGFIHDAEKEIVEARILYSLMMREVFPTPESIGVPAAAFLKGMAESIGELRRHILDLMRQGELERGEELLGAMDDMYYVLVSMDYPDGITFGLRRLTDVTRGIIERTRGDFTTSVIQSSLRTALQQHADQIEGL